MQPGTADQAIGANYGLTPVETQTRLDDAEVRYRKLKNKPTDSRTRAEKKELTFLKRNRGSIESILERETQPLEKRMSKKKVLTLGHKIPDLLGMSELERRDFNRSITGQISMKAMTPAQREQVVVALTKLAKERDINIDGAESTVVRELIAKLEERKQKPSLTRRDRRNMAKLRKVWHTMKSGTNLGFMNASRMRRLCRALDNYENNGPFMRYIYRPVKVGDTKSSIDFARVMQTAVESFREANIDASAMMTEVKDIGIKDKLSTAERIGIFALAQNENTMKHLLSEFSEKEISTVIESVEANEDEFYVAEHIKAYFEQGFPTFQAVAKANGIATGIVKEQNYITAFVTDKNELNDADFMEGLLRQFTDGAQVPGKQHTIARKKGARRNLELNIFVIHARAARSLERFKAMAPVAKNVGKMLNNRGVKAALNNATYGNGSRVMDKWLQDSIRGQAPYDPFPLARAFKWMRMSGINYVLGFKILTAAKQGISLFPAAGIHPMMLPLLTANLSMSSVPAQFKKIEEFVVARSDMVKTRDWNRDLRTAWDKRAVKRMYAGKKLSPISMRMATFVDRHVVINVWKSAYQLAQHHDMNEEESIQFADGVVEDTQPMGKAVDLPNFFRGSELLKNFTVFQNQVNQNGNIFWYDILGETKARKIGIPMMSYRLLVAQLLPAVLLGMVSRGRPPEDLKEVAKDLLFYFVSPFTFIGPWIYNIAVKNYGPRGMIAETPLVEAGRLGDAVRQGDLEKIAKQGARTIGAWTGGKIPLQAITLAEGAIELSTGETDDFRRLIWSKYALKSKKKKTKGGFKH